MHKHKKEDIKKIMKVLVIILLFLSIINLWLMYNLNKKSSEKFVFEPAKIQLITITNSKCLDCFNISPIVDSIKRKNVEIVKDDTLESDSIKAKELINNYGINKIPTVIVAGEVNKLGLSLQFEEKKGILFFSELEPPYTDALTGKIKGKVSVVYLEDSLCKDCTDLTDFVLKLQENNVKITQEIKVDISSSEGKRLVSKYDIEKVPTLIFSDDLALYEEIVDSLSIVGDVKSDGSYVLTIINPPYRNLKTNKIEGLVDVTYVTDESCLECYNTSLHKLILINPLGFNLKLDKEKTVDISSSEGKALLEKYNITLVPTIILSKDADAYSSLKKIWQSVGTIEDDGTYVFRKLSEMRGPYKDLTSNKIIS